MLLRLALGLQGVPLTLPSAPQLRFTNTLLVQHNASVFFTFYSRNVMIRLSLLMLM